MPYRRPLEPNSLYNLATTFDITSGIDNLRPLLAYKEKHPETFPKKRDDGWGLKVREREAEETVIFVPAQVSFNFNLKLASLVVQELLVEYFCRAIWWEILRSTTFADLDTNGNGTIER